MTNSLPGHYKYFRGVIIGSVSNDEIFIMSRRTLEAENALVQYADEHSNILGEVKAYQFSMISSDEYFSIKHSSKNSKFIEFK